jgi:hypothetical protein
MWHESTGELGQSGFVLCPAARVSPDECPAGGHRGPRSRRVIAGSIQTEALDWMPSGSGLRNSTAPRRTAFD